jgi:hypothetical protein
MGGVYNINIFFTKSELMITKNDNKYIMSKITQTTTFHFNTSKKYNKATLTHFLYAKRF